MPRVAIIGGGVSGLSAAYYLERQAPRETAITLYEQSDRLGGVIRSERQDGFCFELGPDSFLSQKTAALKLAEELGLTGHLVNARQRSVFVVRGGRLVPFPTGFQLFVPRAWWSLARTPVVGWGAKLAVLEEFFRRRRPTEEDQDRDISVAEFVRSRLGHEVYEYLAEPLLAGIYGGDAEQLSMAAVLPQFLAYERSNGNVVRGVLRAGREAQKPASAAPAAGSGATWAMFVSFRDGMEELTDALAARLERTTVRRQQGVEDIAPLAGVAAKGASPDPGPLRPAPRIGASLDVARSPGYRIQGEAFDAVVVATPAPVAARLLRLAAPEVAALLAEIPYTAAITVSLGYRAQDRLDAEGGWGFVTPRIENRPVLACSWVSAKFPGRAPEGHVYVRGFLGGARRPKLLDASDGELAALVTEELKTLVGIVQQPEVVKVARWPEAMAQPVVGHPQRIAALRERLAAHPGLAVAGNYLEGIGVPDCIRSAQAAADVCARFLNEAAKNFSPSRQGRKD